MARPLPDVTIRLEAWKLSTIEGYSYRDIGRKIVELYPQELAGRPNPCAATIGKWIKSISEDDEEGVSPAPYQDVLHVPSARERIAERWRVLWEMAYRAWDDGGMSNQEAKAFAALVRIQVGEAALLGLNAATKVSVENVPPGIDPGIAQAINSMGNEKYA